MRRMLAAKGLAPSASADPIPRREGDTAPLSAAQRRMWFLQRLQPGSAANNICVAIRLVGPLDVPRFHRSLGAVIAQHELLRTTYAPGPDGSGVQVVGDQPIKVPLLDFREFAPDVRETVLDDFARGIGARAFDLAAEPPVWLALVRMAEQEHVLLLVAHHIAWDDASWAALLRETAQCYQSGDDVPPLPVQYGDFAAWEKAKPEQLDYWRARLDPAPAELALPTDFPRSATPSEAGGRRRRVLDAEAARRVQDFCREAGATPFMLLLAATKAVLHRYTGADDIAVGSPVVNRDRPELTRVIGNFGNLVVLRTDLAGEPTFRDLLSRVRTTCTEAYARQEMPFDTLVEQLRPPRAPGRSAYFDVLFSLRTDILRDFALPGVEITERALFNGTSQFDLSVAAVFGGDGALTLEATYRAELFAERTVDCLLEHVETLLRGVLDDPDRPLAELPLLAADERDRIMRLWNDTAAEVPRRTIAELIAEQAARTPDAVAVQHAGTALTYRELDETANRLAHKLIADGAGAERFVAVALPRSVELVVALLAVLKTGAGYLPIDPEFPADRIRLMREDADPVAVLDDLAAVRDTAAFPATPPVAAVWPASPAYVIYTSGSTGRPKGVVVPHSALTNFITDMAARFSLGRDDHLLAVTTVSFDIAALELYAPLVAGARVTLAGKDDVRDARVLAELVTSSGATIMQATPALWQSLLDLGRAPLRGLRVLVGGEALPTELAQRMRSVAADVTNLYGPTETTVWSTAATVDGQGAPLVGGPIANTRAYILDATLRPVPAGVPGDLYLGGDGLARGYRGRPDLTAERFVADPFGAPGERLYRTGDRARWTADGSIDFLGRVDHQVKIRGFRIELGEVEAVLAGCAGVARAVVLVREDEPGDKRLVAYLVARPGHALDIAALRAAVADRLPEYMVPSALLVLPELPRTPNGKLDRAALPAPDPIAVTTGRPPRTPREEVLCGLFAEALGVDAVGVDDDFFALGGHSLLVTKLAMRIEAVLGTPVAVRQLFDHSTVARLAPRLGATPASRLPLGSIARPAALPLSPVQRGLWFLHRWHGNAPTYNLPMVVRLAGELDTAALEAALHDVVTRHESLRTLLVQVDDEPRQVIVPADQAELPLLVARSDDASIDADLREAARHRFDLSADLPIRAQLFRLAADRHVLLLLAHHVAGDEWSIDPLAGDLATAYNARRAGAVPEWTPLPAQYADYVLWQRELLGSADDPASALSRQTAFWVDALAGLPQQIELPTDRPRPAVAGADGEFHAFALPADLHRGVRQLARATGTTPFMVLQSAVAALLTRMGAGTDIPIGTPVARRPDERLSQAVGFFVNTLVLRTDTAGNPSFRDLLGRVRAADLAAFDHADVPFEHLVDVLNPIRSSAVNPLFQVALGYQRRGGAGPGMAGLDTAVELVTTGTAKFDLTFVFTETDTGLDGGVEYRADLFDDDTARTLAERLVRLLSTAVADPDAPIGSADVLAPDERSRILVDWNSTGAVRAPATLPALFAEQVDARGDAVAVEFGTTALTYRELDAAANRLARLLLARGAGPERTVAVALPRSTELIIALLAVMKAGACYLALDPDYPAERLEFMLADADVTCVVSTGDLGLDFGALPVVRLGAPDADRELAAAAPHPVTDADRPRPLRVHNLAYLIYTSGSTGRPKGVMVTHEGVAKLVATQRERLGFGSEHAVTMFASPSFDLAFWELVVGLLSGGRLVVFPAELRVPGPALAAYLRDHRVTHTFLPPSVLSVLPEDVELPTGIHLLVGTEAVSPELVRRFGPGRTMFNCYGPTETTVNATLGECDPDRIGASVPIGRPDPGVRAYVLDAALQPVPAGVVGELYLGGAGLARGYLGQPALTSHRFVADPFDGPGARMYRTGDLVRWDDQGRIDFLGRADDQVKIRGFRIEPGEIAAALLRHPDIAQAVVTAREDRPGDKVLVAYAATEGDARPDERDLRSHLSALLPAHLVPSAFVLLDRLPTLPNGKLDRSALPAPDYSARPVGRGPRTLREQQLCALMGEVLGVERVSIDDGFFALGGHSLLATRLVSRIRADLGADVSIRAVFEAPTVADLAERISDGGARGPALVARADSADAGLSFAQQRLWFLHQMEGPSPTYNIPAAFRLSGPLDADVLRAALADVIARHDQLRTLFGERDGKPSVHVRSVSEPVLEFVDTTPDELEARLTAASRHVFDIAVETPLRTTVFRLPGGESVLLLLLHHIAGDGASIGVLTADLSTAYAARSAGSAPQWTDLPLRYADYTLWQRDLLGDTDDADSVIGVQSRFWADALAGAPEELALPADRSRPAEAGHRGDLVDIPIGANLAAGVRALAADRGISPFMVFQAALAALLTRLGAGSDIPIGTPVAGRADGALDGLVGFFVNTLVLRTDTSGDPTFAELLDRVRDADLAAFAHQDLPFERLVEIVSPQRSQARHPLFQVMLVHNDVADVRPTFSGVTARPEVVRSEVAKVDLTVTVVERMDAESIAGFLEYSTDLFDRGTAESIAARLTALLAAAVADPSAPISAAEILTDAERHAVVNGWNDTAHPVPRTTLPALFAAQAASTPDATAIIVDGNRLSYAELDAAANRLAHLLVERGARPETVVAVAVPRSVELIVALYAVHKAGAAYLPIDPDYPADRIGFMLDDAAPALVLTTAAVEGVLPASHERVLLDDEAVVTSLWDYPATAPVVSVDPRCGAYLIYTSGSTGRPKGVLVSHEAIVNRLLWAQDTYRLDATDRVLQKTPSSFDVSVWEFFWPLLAGAALVVAQPDGHKDPEYLARLIQTEGVTTVHFVPSMLRAFLAEPTVSGCESLRRVICSGEALPADLAAQVGSVLPRVELHNLYGPTEAAVDVTSWACVEPGPVVPIGRPVWNTGVRVLDGALRPVPPGVPGELYLTGVQLARGYRGRPGLTAERFVADPYGPPGARMYRTGDLARWRGDGVVEYLGRVDHQVKLRGFRIELGEIEAVLGRHPAVTACAVVVREDVPGAKRLVGYVTGGETDDLARHCAASLPEFMVPTAFVRLDELPLSPSGKLDRGRLPAPAVGVPAGQDEASTPREQVLCELFADLLGVPVVGANDGFFALGGDSILSIQLVSRARAAGLVITPRDVFRHQTPAELAAAATVVETVISEPAGYGVGVLPATPVMHWLAERGGPIDAFSQSVLVRTPAGADEDTVVAALQAVLDHHDALRARLVGNPWSLDIPAPGTVSARDLLTRVVGADVDTEARAALSRLRPRDGVMCQAVWFDAGPHEQGRLLLTVHHLVIDGVSWRILLADLAAAWQAVTTGARVALPEVRTSLRRFAELSASTRVDDTDTWLSLVDGPSVALVDRPLDPAVDTESTAARHETALPAEITAPLLTRVPELFHAGVNDVLLAALALAVADWRHPGALLVDVEGHGRDALPDTDLSRTVGWFTTVSPARLDPGPVGDVGTAVKQVKEQLRALPPAATFGQARYLDPEAGPLLARLPRPQLLFNYLGRLSTGDTTDFAVDPTPLPPGVDQDAPIAYPLELTVITLDRPTGPELHATWRWPSGALTETAVAALATHWSTHLEALVTHAAGTTSATHTPSDLALVSLSQDEIDEFEAEWL